MQLELTLEQFRQLLVTFKIGSYVQSGVLDVQEQDWQYLEALEELLLTKAKADGLSELLEEVEEHLVVSEQIDDESMSIIEDYNDIEFWDELATMLGQRDFYRETSPEELEQAKENGLDPEKIDAFYTKYEDEFTKNGINRLMIDESIEESSIEETE